MTTPDLHRLSPAEREVLALLAQGHTAKSIATSTGRTEGAVNERLREARRKTGVGSSRELARLLARETRDEVIGVGGSVPVAPGPGRVPPLARLLGALVMTITIAGLVTVALMLSVPKAQTSEPPAPNTLFRAAAGAQYGDAESWRYETLAQPRNAAWADAHEAVLRRRYAAIKGLDMASLRVMCRESKCEVVGRSAAGASATTLQQAVDELTSPAMRSSLAADGLHADFTSCNGRDVTREVSFLAYWVSPDD